MDLTVNLNGKPGDDDHQVLVASRLSKAYPGVQALDAADFVLRRNEIHALVGSNGAGKSTLVKVIAGREHPEAGTLTIDGVTLDHSASDYLQTYSIGYVSQEGSLDPELKAFENVFLGRELKHNGLVSYRRMLQESRDLAEEFGFNIDLQLPARDLSPSQRKIVEILRALSLRPKVLILDEPTAALPRPDIDHLLGIMRSLVGTTSIIFVSHYMNEIFHVSDRITVMREGRNVSTAATSTTSPDQLVADMLGDQALQKHRDNSVHVSRRVVTTAAPVLVAAGLATTDGRVTDGNMTLRPGEITGLFGMVGAGKSELLEALYGMRRIETAELSICDRPVEVRRWSVRKAITTGLALVPEDRLKNALVADESSAWNLAAPHWRRSTGLLVRLKKLESTLGAEAQALVTIRGELYSQPISTLSGGNKQKVSVCRWLVAQGRPRILLLDEPTQGLDVIAREEIYSLLRQLAQDGVAILLSSCDLEEVASISDRFFVIRNGASQELDNRSRSRDRLLLAATSDINERSVHV